MARTKHFPPDGRAFFRNLAASASVDRSGDRRFGWSGDRPIAVFFQSLNPARRIPVHHERLVIDPSIAIRLAMGEHEVDDTDHLVTEGDDGFLVALAPHQALIFAGEATLGSSGGVGGFAEQITDRMVALAGLTRLALAGGFMVAGT